MVNLGRLSTQMGFDATYRFCWVLLLLKYTGRPYESLCAATEIGAVFPSPEGALEGMQA